MGIVSRPNTYANGDAPENIIDAGKLNDDFDTLYALVNGQLDKDNLSQQAGILLSQLAQAVQDAIPGPGDLKASFKGADHNGWLLCDGRLVMQADYPNLFAVIGHTANGGTDPGGGQFKLPDYRDRFVIGASSTRPLGSLGGQAQVALTVAQLPAHTHTYQSSRLAFSPGGVGGDAFFAVGGQQGTGGTYSMDQTGSGQAHDNIPPYQAANIFIKT